MSEARGYFPMAYGDVVDRMIILGLKLAATQGARQALVKTELEGLRSAWVAEGLPEVTALEGYEALVAVNAALWAVEDRLRAAEAKACFDAEFVADARSVYRLNDERASLKRQLSAALGSPFVEVKAYGA